MDKFKPYIIVSLVCLILGGFTGFFLDRLTQSPDSPLLTKPGGNWRQDPFVKDGILYVEFHAHPSNIGDPPIKFVDPTIFFAGSWHHLCPPNGVTIPDPPTSDLYICRANILALTIPSGTYKVSCNVYDIAWRPNKLNDDANIGLGGSKQVTIP